MSASDKKLIGQLTKIGLEPDLIPGFISFASKICARNCNITVSELNERLVYLGWQGLELDYRTHEVLMSYVNNEVIPNMKRVSYRRIGYERRVVTYDMYIPERRGFNGNDRREGSDRRK